MVLTLYSLDQKLLIELITLTGGGLFCYLSYIVFKITKTSLYKDKKYEVDTISSVFK